MAKTTGIRVRHSRTCPEREGARCKCSPSFEAWVYSKRDGGKIRRTFTGKGALDAAKGWRADATGNVRRGTMRAPTPTTVREAADAYLAGARDGTIRARNGQPYRPSAIRGYETTLRLRVLPDLGARKLSDVTRFDLQDLVDRMLAKGLDPSTIHNTLMPLRAIYRRALRRGDVTVNPTSNLEIPAVTGRRDRIASPPEAEELLAAVPVRDRALWATAMYAGLRRGELMALRWEDIDFERGVIVVERAYDPPSRRIIEPKTKAGRRAVPLASVLRAHLREHQLRTGRRDGLVFGRDAATPFQAEAVRKRARAAWSAANAKRAEQEIAALEPIGLHEARHTFASWAIAAGVNAKALSTYMGHSSITITLDRYGHLMPGNEDEAAGLLDSYLERATGAQTGAQHA